jgi:endonuclease YncB( thermonuclease family)
MKTALLPILLAAMAVPAAAEVVSGQAQIIDGDTLALDGRRIRLFGIDAPELPQSCDRNGEAWACGEESRTQLEAIIGGQLVSCEGDELDPYDRLVAVCSAGRYELNRTMVEAGWATAFRKYSQDYVAAEIRARGERRGLWRSTFLLPEQYRLAASASDPEPQARRASPRAAPASSRQPGGCVIKGNRSRRGEWIYHLPGRPYYDQTRAEEMFCTEEEAIAAGYRRSKA